LYFECVQDDKDEDDEEKVSKSNKKIGLKKYKKNIKK
jgi:hypothetical protein